MDGDARLVRLCDELLRLTARRDAPQASYFATGEDVPDAIELELDAAAPRVVALRRLISETPATTPAGLAAKARAIVAEGAAPAEADRAALWSVAVDASALAAR